MTAIGKLAIENMVIVMFVYGLTLFILGMTVLLSSLRPTSLKFAKYLPWLAAFGFAHAFNQWFDMLTFIDQYKFLAESWVYAVLKILIFSSIPFFLFKFGAEVLAAIDNRFRYFRVVPFAFYLVWLVVFASSFMLTGFGIEQLLKNGEILIRYLLTFPGATIAGYAMFLQYRVFLKQGFGATSNSFLIAAIAIWLKAITCGLIVPYAPYFPASVINYDSFVSLTGVPIFIFRIADALLIAFGIVRGMHVFNIEEEKQEQRRSRELLTLENISREIGRSPDLSRALMWVTSEVVKLFDARAGAIFMVDMQTGKPDVVAEQGFVADFAQKFKRIPPSIAEKCPVRKVIKERTLFATSEAMECPLILGSAKEPERVNAVAILPLIAKTQALGAMVLLFSQKEDIKPSNLELLGTISNQIGLAIENVQLEEQRRIALILQRSLLPKIPSMPGIEIGVHYQSATVGTEVGGDFYDFVDLGDGLLGIAIGDVVGSGIDAATAVSMIKYAMEGFAFENNSPADIMKKLNDLACRQMTAGRFVTVFCGTLDIQKGLLVFSNAGHLPPLIIKAKTKEAVFLDKDSGIALGVTPDGRYPERQVLIDPGDVLIMYTDGLVEARQNRDLWGEERLVNTAKDNIDLPAQALADKICGSAREFSGGILTDDIATVVIRSG